MAPYLTVVPAFRDFAGATFEECVYEGFHSNDDAVGGDAGRRTT